MQNEVISSLGHDLRILYAGCEVRLPVGESAKEKFNWCPVTPIDLCDRNALWAARNRVNHRGVTLTRVFLDPLGLAALFGEPSPWRSSGASERWEVPLGTLQMAVQIHFKRSFIVENYLHETIRPDAHFRLLGRIG